MIPARRSECPYALSQAIRLRIAYQSLALLEKSGEFSWSAMRLAMRSSSAAPDRAVARSWRRLALLRPPQGR